MTASSKLLNIGEVARVVEHLAPRSAAAAWDNVGLLIGSYGKKVQRIMTCLTVTPSTCEEAVARQVDLIISHHPVLFRGAKSITDRTYEGRMLLQLMRHDIGVYSAHTAFDNVAGGINEMIAEGLQLGDIEALRALKVLSNQGPHDGLSQSGPQDLPGLPGEGRIGLLPKAKTLSAVVEMVANLFEVRGMHVVGDPKKEIRKIAMACGAAGEFMKDALKKNADLFVTGEMRFHDCLVAEAEGLALCIPGHFATERFSMVRFADWLKQRLPGVDVFASQQESDPLRWAQL